MNIEIIEVFSFLRQLGFAVAGAAALWGFVFLFFARHKEGLRCNVFTWIGRRLSFLFFGGSFIAAVALVGLYFFTPVFAHEGIVIVAEHDDIQAALAALKPWYGLWALITLFGLGAWMFAREFFNTTLHWFYLLQFVATFLLISFPAWTGEFNSIQAFFAGHSFHSIFTFGTVIVLDFLFISSLGSNVLKQHIYPYFPTISKVIWVGLGFDFLSVALVFDEAIRLTAKFFFMQTVIGILIINGTILSGILTRKMLRSVQDGAVPLTKRWTTIANIAGTISVSSWFTITFLDSFEGLLFGYWQFVLGYVLLIVTLYIAHMVSEYFHVEKFPVLAYTGGECSLHSPRPRQWIQTFRTVARALLSRLVKKK